MRLKDKVSIITGASSGIGRATALRFAEEGSTVVVVARRLEKLEEMKKEAENLPGKIIPMKADVSNDKEIKKVVKDTMHKFGQIDILINNAGILDAYLSVEDMDDKTWDKVMDVNVTAPMKVMREVLPHMIERNKGSIVNTASVGGLFGGRGGAAYVTSKHAIVGLTKHVGAIYGDKGIRCNAVAPGSVATEIGTKIDQPVNEDVLNKLMKYAELSPAPTDPRNIANAMLFLASDESSFVNGEILVADGGWTVF